jgi:ABC-type transporter Mla MlaB component
MVTPKRTIVCDLGGLAQPDLGSIDALARLQLMLRPQGLEVLLRGAPNELIELIALVGLTDVLRVESGREAEQRKQRLGVEEERELPDPPP